MSVQRVWRLITVKVNDQMKKMFAFLAAAFLCAGCVPEEYFLRIDQEAKTPVRIAAVIPLSGKNKIYAEQMMAGMVFAVEQINAQNGVNGRNLQFKVFDSTGTPVGAVAAMEDAAKWGASGIIAGYDSDEVSAAISRSGELRLPTVIPLATSDQHTDLSPFIYRNSYTDTQQSEMLMSYLYHWRKARTIGIFIDTRNALYSQNLARSCAQAFQDCGGSVVSTVQLQGKNIPDKIIQDMVMADVDAVVIPADGKRAAEILKKLRNAGFHGIIAGTDTWDDIDFISSLDDFNPGECVFTAFFSDENSSAEYIRFKSAFRKRFYYNPGACETQSYDALKFLVIGLSTAETLPDFDKNWRTIRNHQGAAATYTMLKKGKIDRTIYLNTVGIDKVNGKFRPYSRLSRKIQYSKLEEYKESFYEVSDRQPII